MPEAKPDAALDVVDLKTEFKVGSSVYRAVGGVSLDLKDEECLGLVGESGSGKSVTAMSILGLVATPPGTIVGGRVVADGMDLFEIPDDALRDLRGGGISMIFQDPLSTLHPLFTVGDQITEAVRAHRPISYAKAWTRAVELLELVRIPNARDRADSYPHELSGGMRQRVCIAMALANDSSMMIADEPTTALDVTVQAQVLRLLDDLRRDKGAAVLFITHDFGVVSEICERVAVMYAGRIVEYGAVDDIFSSPRHPYTAGLLASMPRFDRPGELRLASIDGSPPDLGNLPAGCAFAPRCPRQVERCVAEIPVLEQMGDRRRAACWRMDRS
jgi:peptide/nickel transport system permease protein